ncbi:MAG: hypothetical protein V1689_04285 [Pseudomonadota bacterium]
MQRIRKTTLLVFLAFPYLLIGMAGPYSFTWCLEENGPSHLEYGITGTCQIVHQSGCNPDKGAPPPSVSFVNSAISCLDVPLLSIQGLSQAPASFDKDLLLSSQAVMAFVLQTSEGTIEKQALILEPSLSVFALKALRTVVLLI